MTPCVNCQSELFTTKKVWVEHGELQGMCSDCGDFFTETVPDVFFKTAYTSKALNVEFTSKGQKAKYLKEHGLSEAGDRGSMSEKSWTEGTREHRRKVFNEVDRPKIRQALREFRQKRGGR